MSEPTESFKQWLPEVAADQICVDTSEAGLNREANTNRWKFTISAEQASRLSSDSVIEFLLAVRSARNDQILSRFGRAHAMTMYCWAHYQDASLNLSLVSTSHGCLPFGAPVELADDLREIVDAFLKDPYHDGIPFEEFTVVGKDDPPVEDSPLVPVRVWTSSLPD